MKYFSIKFKILLLLILTVISAAFTGCAAQGKKEQASILWVVTEETNWDGMNSQASQMIEVFEAEHPGYSVNLDILPRDEVMRASYLKHIRTAIMAGKGPDVFLLPTSSVLIGSADWELQDFKKIREVEPLFPDVKQAMLNGLFQDVSSFYNADSTLGKESFNSVIMDAGTIQNNTSRDGRYILPLRYSFPTLLVEMDLLEKYGLSLDDLDRGIQGLMDTATSRNSHTLACSVEPQNAFTGRGLSFLPPVLDYSGSRVTVTSEEIAQFLRSVQQVEKLVGWERDHRFKVQLASLAMPGKLYYKGNFPMFPNYSENPKTVWDMNLNPYKMFPYFLPMRVAALEDAIVISALSKVDYGRYSMIPIRGSDGFLSAYVTYWGAIGGGCKHPDEAYSFLRLFLTEDAQYERDRPWIRDAWCRFPYHLSLIEEGWPVRSVNGTDQVWRKLRTASPLLYHDGLLPRERLMKTHLTDADFPLVSVKIDRVYWGGIMEQKLSKMVWSLNDPKTGKPTDVDIDKMAADFVEDLTYRVNEG